MNAPQHQPPKSRPTQEFALLLFLALGGCGGTEQLPDPKDPRDVSGNYALTFDREVTLTFKIPNGFSQVTQTGDGVTDFGVYRGQPMTMNLREFCSKPEVRCPDESLWANVAIEQPNLAANKLNLQELRIIDDTVHVPAAGVKAASRTGLVDHGNQDKFLLGLGAEGAGNNNCLPFDVSWVSGRLSRVDEKPLSAMEYRDSSGMPCSSTAVSTCRLEPVTKLSASPGAAVHGIKDGKVAMWFSGECAFGPAGAGASFGLEVRYTATRTGDFDPPPFTSEPVLMPKDGPSAEGGVP